MARMSLFNDVFMSYYTITYIYQYSSTTVSHLPDIRQLTPYTIDSAVNERFVFYTFVPFTILKITNIVHSGTPSVNSAKSCRLLTYLLSER